MQDPSAGVTKARALTRDLSRVSYLSFPLSYLPHCPASLPLLHLSAPSVSPFSIDYL